VSLRVIERAAIRAPIRRRGVEKEFLQRAGVVEKLHTAGALNARSAVPIVGCRLDVLRRSVGRWTVGLQHCRHRADNDLMTIDPSLAET
jgi:predicted transcriptional regulator YheO